MVRTSRLEATRAQTSPPPPHQQDSDSERIEVPDVPEYDMLLARRHCDVARFSEEPVDTSWFRTHFQSDGFISTATLILLSSMPTTSDILQQMRYSLRGSHPLDLIQSLTGSLRSSSLFNSPADPLPEPVQRVLHSALRVYCGFELDVHEQQTLSAGDRYARCALPTET